MEIENKIALVTGGANGIGFQYAKHLLKNGAKNVAILDLENSNGDKSARELNQEFGKNRAIFVICDVTKPEEFEAAFQKTVTEFGGLDIVINNAGIMKDGVWELMININVTAAVRGTLLAFKHMGKDRGGKGGVIVNIASIAGLIPVDFLPIYVGTKHAVVGFSRSFGTSSTYDKTGVRVLVLCPGVTDTELISKAVSGKLDMVDEKHMEFCIRTVPRQSPEVVAKAMIQIIRTASTGSVWVIKDGQPIWEVKFPSYDEPM